MRDLTPALLAYLQSDSFDPIYCLDITLPGQNPNYSIHLTSAQEEITFQPYLSSTVNTYSPYPFAVSDFMEVVAASIEEAPELKISASNVTSQLSSVVNSAIAEMAKVVVYFTDRRLIDSLTVRPRNACRLTFGQLRNLQLNDTAMSFSVVNIMAQQQRVTIPKRVYQASCNYIFGSKACGVDRINGSDSNGIPFHVAGVAQAGTTASYVMLPSAILGTFGSPIDPTSLFASSNSDILMTNGPSGLQSQSIQRVVMVGGNPRFYLRNSFLTSPNVGDTLYVRRFCARTITACQLNQGNINQFGGMPQVPPVLFRPTLLKAPKALT